MTTGSSKVTPKATMSRVRKERYWLRSGKKIALLPTMLVSRLSQTGIRK